MLPNEPLSYHIGHDGFLWFVGVVESTDDVLGVGRCKVRMVGWHREDVPMADLPWAYPAQPITDPTTPHSLKPGDWVGGFFIDGKLGQKPIIQHVYPTIPQPTPENASLAFRDPRTLAQLKTAPRLPLSRELSTTGVVITENDAPEANPTKDQIDRPMTPRLALGGALADVDAILKDKKRFVTTGVPNALGATWDEPVTPYAARFPYNRVQQSASGHVIEVDDTPGAERVHVFHRSGSFIEFHPDGSLVVKSLKHGYCIALADQFVKVAGNCNITVDGTTSIYSLGDCYVKTDERLIINAASHIVMTAGGSIVMDAKSIEMTGKSGINLNSDGDVDINAQDFNVKVDGAVDLTYVQLPGNVGLVTPAGGGPFFAPKVTF